MSDLRYTGSEPLIPLSQATAEGYLANSNFGVSYNSYDLNWMLTYNSQTPIEVPKFDLPPPANVHGPIAGIRVYEGIQPTEEQTIIGVGVHESTFDVRGNHPYLRSNGNNIDGYATRLTKQVAIDHYLTYPQGSGNEYYAYFSQAAINNILAKDGVLGIRFYSIDYPIDGKNYKNFMMVGVYKNEAGQLVDRSGDNEYVVSDVPCPPKCPHNGKKALFSKGK